MTKFGSRLVGDFSHGAGLPPPTYEDHSASDTLAIADAAATFTFFVRVDEFLDMVDVAAIGNVPVPAIADTLAVEDLGGVLGAMAMEEDLTLTDTSRNWVTTGSTMPVEAIAISDAFNVYAPFAFAETLAVEDLGGVLGTFALDDDLALFDSGRSWVNGGTAIVITDPLAIADSNSYTVSTFLNPDTLAIADAVASMNATKSAAESATLSDSFSYSAIVSAIADSFTLSHGTPTYTANFIGSDTLAIAESYVYTGSLARTESLTLSDSNSYSAIVSAINEALGIADGTATYAANFTSADTLAIADAAATYTANFIAADTLAIADAAPSYASSVTGAETVGIADGTAAVTAATFTNTDTLAIAESASQTSGTVTGAETLAVADGTASYVGTIAAAETLALADAAPTFTGTVASADTLALVDAAPVYGVVVGDTLAIADGTATYAAAVTGAETLAIADSGASVTGAAYVDTLAIAESGSATGGSLTNADTLAIADGTATYAAAVSGAETLAIADSGASVTSGTVAGAETLAIADSGASVTSGTVVGAETLAIAESASNTGGTLTFPDTLAIAESSSNTGGSLTNADTLAIAESSSQTSATFTTADTLAIADGTATWQDSGSNPAPVSDTLAIADSATWTATFAAADTLAIADGTAAIIGSGSITTAADTLAIADATPSATQEVVHVATGTVGSATTGVTPGQPSGVVAGDLLLLLCETANEAVSTPSGWTIAPSSPQSTGTAAATTATRLSIFYRIATGSDAAVISDPGDHLIARIIAYRGVNTTTPFQTSTGDTAAASTAVTIPSITTTQPKTKVLLCLANAFDSSTSQAGTLTNANLLSINERIDDNTASGNGGGITLNEAVMMLPGAIGTSSLTLANSVVQARIALALNAISVSIGAGGGSGISVLQVTPEESFDGVTGLTKNITGVTAGSLLVGTIVYGDQSNASSKPPPTTPSGWTLAIAPNSSIGTVGYKGQTAIYYKENAASGSHSLVITDFRTDCYAWASITEVAGCLTSGALDQTASQLSTANSTSSSVTATSAATAQANEIVFAVGSLSGTGVSAHSIPQSGYTEIGSEPTDSVHTAYGSGYKIVSATGAQSAQVTITGSSEGMVVLATFKGA